MSIKNVVIFGATAETGKHLVKFAAEQGLNVTAVARAGGSKPSFEGANIKVMEGSLTDADFIDSCIAGQDLVLSSLGNRLPGLAIWNYPTNPEYLEACNKLIIKSMKKHGVKKACIVSALGVGSSYGQIGFVFKTLLNITALKHAYVYLEIMEKVWMSEAEPEIDFCLVRPPALTSGPLTGKTNVVPDGFKMLQISRADLAKWIVEASVKDGKFAERTPIVAS